jgi:hypothetical protein
VTPDRKLEIELPEDTPIGEVEVEIRPSELTGIPASDLLNSDLVGIWADRKDINDTIEFARSLRKRTHP